MGGSWGPRDDVEIKRELLGKRGGRACGGVRYQLLKQKRHRDTNEKKEERGGKNALEAQGGHFCGPLPSLSPLPPDRKREKEQLKA